MAVAHATLVDDVLRGESFLLCCEREVCHADDRNAAIRNGETEREAVRLIEERDIAVGNPSLDGD